MMQTYIIKVEPLTAVHIGTGEDMDPMSYTIKGNHLIRFRPENVISRMPADKMVEFERLIDSNEHPKIAALLHSEVTNEDALYVMPVSPEVSRKFNASLGLGENQLIIGTTYRDKSSQKAVIPGSSLKGAIRTALADKLARAKQLTPPDERKSKWFEQKVFDYSDAKNDPFRAIKISDCPINGEQGQTVSDYVNFKEHRQRSEDFSRMSMMKEQIIGPLCSGDANGACQLTIDEDLQQIRNHQNKWQPLSEKFDLQDIVLACHEFYSENFRAEYAKFYAKSKYRELQINAKKVLDEIGKIDPKKNQCLIRLGRFSQVENITLSEPYRKPWNRKGYGATRTLTEDYFPAGLVRLTFMSQEDFRKEKAIQAEAEQKLALAEKERVESERLEQERLANMSPDDKMLDRIQNLTNDTDLIGKIVTDCFNQDLSKTVFNALKEKLQQLNQWAPSGSKQRKLKIQKRNEKIVSKL